MWVRPGDSPLTLVDAVETPLEQVPAVGVIRLWYQVPVWLAMVRMAVDASTLLACSVASTGVATTSSDQRPSPAVLVAATRKV